VQYTWEGECVIRVIRVLVSRGRGVSTVLPPVVATRE